MAKDSDKLNTEWAHVILVSQSCTTVVDNQSNVVSDCTGRKNVALI